MASIAISYHIPPKEFEKQYKHHLSNFKTWDQKEHAVKWLCFPKNIGAHLSLDEVAISNGELYTVLTNKAARGGKGSLVAMIEGTRSKDIVRVLANIPPERRGTVTEVTLDFAPSMAAAVRDAFPAARVTIDRFHVQKMVTEALQEMRIKKRWAAIEEENEAVRAARAKKKRHTPPTYENGDTKKQLLSRSRYLLFKPKSKWSPRQAERSTILFREFPDLEHGYNLSMMFRACYEDSVSREDAVKRFKAWYTKIEKEKLGSFLTAAHYIKNHEETILNYFPNRNTNAAAESFNAKLKGFRALVRGVRDRTFFLYRVSTLYA